MSKEKHRPAPVRVWISYAHDDAQHIERVRQFGDFLRGVGIDARLDLPDSEQPQDWPLWMLQQQKLATYILVVSSPEYRRRSEGETPPHQGRGVQYESFLIRSQQYGDLSGERRRVLPVVLPGGSAQDIPIWLGGMGSTRYEITAFTIEGADRLLRYLTGQPFEIERPLGQVPVLAPRTPWARPEPQPPEARLRTLVRQIADRSGPRNESIVQAQIRQLLTADPVGLAEADLGVELDDRPEGQRRIDLRSASTVVEVRDDLRRRGVRAEAEAELGPYLDTRARATGQRWVAVVTDGADWLLYRRSEEGLRLVDQRTIDATRPDVHGLLGWLEALLASNQRLLPTPQSIVATLGADSPAYALDYADLADLYARHRERPEVAIKRRLWSKLLTTALGTKFDDQDSLFVNHTLLVVMAEIIGHAVVGIAPDADDVSATSLLSGERFAASDVRGVVEPDFFDWVAGVSGGAQFLSGLARRLTRFAWNDVQHDVMKVLYESIIGSTTRKLLGEYYTPDWLAERVVKECVPDPLGQRVLDASCGSGTFLFHAVRSYLEAALDRGLSLADAIAGVTTHVMGVDVHPVAVTLARVTYLLAIGMDRLLDPDRPGFAVPVYLGDSLRWSEESTLLSYPGLSVSTAEDHEMYAGASVSDEQQLLFPDRVVDDAVRFDQLVTEMAERATDRRRRSIPPSLSGTFDRLDVEDEDRPTLTETFRKMCRLHDESRDHIWAYYVRNLARPLWLARPRNRVDVLVGNSPWLFYRNMTRTQQAAFRSMSLERGLWTGGGVATNQDLSALFVVRCIELYLKTGGSYGFVMPQGVFSRAPYQGFKRGSFPVQAEPVIVAFGQPWDLQGVKPAFFPMPAAVIFGRRLPARATPVPLTQVPETWTGRLAKPDGTWAEASGRLTRMVGERPPVPDHPPSPYAQRFAQGATVVPRMLFVVEPDESPPLGVGAGSRPVRSRRSPNEKEPWKSLPALRGTVEKQFVRPLYVGDAVLPFRLRPPSHAVVPWDGKRLLHGADGRLDRYRGLARWWRDAEEVWEHNRSSDRLSLVEQLNFRRKLSQQLPAPPLRVVYSKSGMYLAATVVTDAAALVDHKLYWGAAEGWEEARFLTAILNSTATTLAVRPLQARGEHNPRDFDKYVWQLPIPVYDPADSAHRWLVTLAERAEEVAAGVELPALRFETQRRRIREALDEDGVATDIDAIVKTLITR